MHFVRATTGAALPLLIAQMGLAAAAVECSNSTQDWDCADHLRMRELNGMYLGEGLRCMGYDKFQSPYALASNEVERNLTSWVSVDIKFTRINELNDEVQVGGEYECLLPVY